MHSTRVAEDLTSLSHGLGDVSDTTYRGVFLYASRTRQSHFPSLDGGIHVAREVRPLGLAACSLELFGDSKILPKSMGDKELPRYQCAFYSVISLLRCSCFADNGGDHGFKRVVDTLLHRA